MKYKVFSLPAQGDADSEQSLNDFLTRHKLIQVDRQFVAQGDMSYWSICVGYQSAAVANVPPNSKKSRVDYKDVLNERDFACFAALRELRKSQAERDGVPVFAVFTNEQLAQMAQNRISTVAQLKSLEGVGDSKVTRYGDVFLTALQEFWTHDDA